MGAALALAMVGLAALGYQIFRLYKSSRAYEWSGTVEAKFVNVGSRRGGRVREVLVREGDDVEAHAGLIVLEAGEIAALRVQAEGQLAEAEATLDRVRAGARSEEIAQAKARASQASAAFQQVRKGARSEQIAAAEARLQAAQARVDKAVSDADRVQRLLQSQAVPRADLDDAQATMRSAISERDALRNVLDELTRGARPEEIRQAAARAQEAREAARMTEAGSRVEDVRAAQAKVTEARGRLEQITVDLSELTIRAPHAARVESLDLRPGDLLAQNATAARLLEPGQLFVRIYVPETQLGYVRPGLRVPISVDSFPGRTFRGVVEFVSSEGEFTPRNLQTADERANHVFAARVRIEEGTDVLRAGMTAVARVRP
jgi:HlyD family secretion protein